MLSPSHPLSKSDLHVIRRSGAVLCLKFIQRRDHDGGMFRRRQRDALVAVFFDRVVLNAIDGELGLRH